MAKPQSTNNPFALIQPKPDPWKGLAGSSPDGFLKFQSPYYGARAGFINLVNTYLNKGLDTIEKIFPVYAPKGHGANDPEVYIKNASAFSGIPRNKKIVDKNDIYKLGKAIVQQEEGKFWMNTKDFDTAFTDAMNQVKFSGISTPAAIAGGSTLIILLIVTLILLA